jgi:hypothetical protein
MISLYYNSDNLFSQYGINHFIEKFGIPIELNKPSQSGIIIAYGVKISGAFVINIEENEIKNTICGKILTQYEKIPLCEKPRDTGPDDEAIAFFETEEFKYPCVTRNDHGFSIGVDIFKETGYLLSGHLDSIWPSLDSTTKKELASKPSVDFLENILFNAILTGCREQKIPLIQKSYWPEGKTFAVCLTHDVDELKKTYQWFTRPFRFFIDGNFKGFSNQFFSFAHKIRGVEPYYTYDDIIRLENNLKVKSTYFMLKESGHAKLSSRKTLYLYGRNRSFNSPKMQNLLIRLKENGDEIGIHGSYFSYNNPQLLLEETKELEHLIQEKIIGTRQHNLNLDVPKTWEYQVQCGLQYDSSLGFVDRIGFRWGTSFPFFPNSEMATIPIIEIPLIIMDVCLDSCDNILLDCQQVIDEVERYSGVLTLLWHPPVINELEYKNGRDIYIKLIQYCQTKETWIKRACDICAWIKIRNQCAFSCDYNGSNFSILISQLPHDYYFTIYLPSNTDCEIISKNAKIIKKERDYVYIKTHHDDNNYKVDLVFHDS